MRASHMSGSVVLLLSALWHLTTADVDVISDEQNVTIATMDDAMSAFGPAISSDGISGPLMISVPETACTPVNMTLPVGYQWILLIRRGNCTFEEKVWQAQKAGFHAAIVYDPYSDVVTPMNGDGSHDIEIPSVFVGHNNGIMLHRFNGSLKYHLHITNKDEFDFADYLIPFAIIIAVCFVILVIIMIYRCWVDYRRSRRHRLPRRVLDTLPTRRFCAAEDPYDTCAICLDDYEEGEKLRILPCNHAYHAKCVDPWLTRSKRVCPVCKRRVLEGDDSDASDVEDPPTERESEPLLEPRARRGYGATTAAGAGAGASGGRTRTGAAGASREGTDRPQQTRRPPRGSRRARRQQRVSAVLARATQEAGASAAEPVPVHDDVTQAPNGQQPSTSTADVGQTPESQSGATAGGTPEPRGRTRGGYSRLQEEPVDDSVTSGSGGDEASTEVNTAAAGDPEPDTEPDVVVVSGDDGGATSAQRAEGSTGADCV